MDEDGTHVMVMVMIGTSQRAPWCDMGRDLMRREGYSRERRRITSGETKQRVRN